MILPSCSAFSKFCTKYTLFYDKNERNTKTNWKNIWLKCVVATKNAVLFKKKKEEKKKLNYMCKHTNVSHDTK